MPTLLNSHPLVIRGNHLMIPLFKAENTPFRATSVLCFFFVLSGCATLSKTECKQANWQEIGFEDAAEGYAVTRIREHRKACSKYNVSPDLNRYRTGYHLGLKEFCRYPNGVKKGLAGYQYGGICPADLEEDFLAGYHKGFAVYEARSKRSKQEAELNRLRTRLQDKEELISKNEALITSSSSTADQRSKALEIIRDAEREIGGIKSKLHDGELEVDHLYKEEARLKSRLSPQE